MIAYWYIFLFLSFLLGLILLFILNYFVDRNSKLKRLGGIALILPFVIFMFLSGIEMTNPMMVMTIGSAMIMLLGIWDDFFNLSWKVQILFQLALIFFAISLGSQIEYISLIGEKIFYLNDWQISIGGSSISIVSAIFVLFWYLLIINSINWVDGIDGLMGAISLVALTSILIVSLRPEVNQPALAVVCLIVIGSLLAFTRFNFPPAKIIAGTSGSYFLGFILASLAIMAGTKIATLLIVLALPIIDAIWVIINRLKNKRSIFLRDKNQRHFHYQLRKLGWSDQKILVSFFAFLFIIFLLTFFLDNRVFKIGILIFEVVFISFFIGLTNRRVKRMSQK